MFSIVNDLSSVNIANADPAAQGFFWFFFGSPCARRGTPINDEFYFWIAYSTGGQSSQGIGSGPPLK